jgi:hypothetical protein
VCQFRPERFYVRAGCQSQFVNYFFEQLFYSARNLFPLFAPFCDGLIKELASPLVALFSTASGRISGLLDLFLCHQGGPKTEVKQLLKFVFHGDDLLCSCCCGGSVPPGCKNKLMIDAIMNMLSSFCKGEAVVLLPVCDITSIQDVIQRIESLQL